MCDLGLSLSHPPPTGLFGVPGAAKLSISSTTSAGVSITTTATSNTAGSK